MEKVRYLGFVEDGQFKLLKPVNGIKAGTALRFTRISMQAAERPEGKEIKVADYEGKAVLIEGKSSGDWVYWSDLIGILG